MSVSSVPKAALILLVVAATGAVGYLVATGGAGAGSDDAAPSASTVLTTPDAAVEVVPKATASQAAQAVSSRLFGRSDVAVLTAADAASRTAAIATATRIKVPVLLDDPAAPAELARLRSTVVLTFGATGSVVGATPITGDAAAMEQQVDAAIGSHEPPAAPKTPAVVLVKSAAAFDVAAATAKSAGATVVESSAADPRVDPTLAAALAEVRDNPVVAIGAPFTDSLPYTLAAVRAKATQLGGGYLTLPGKAYISLHGRLGDPASGPAGRLDTAGSLDLLKRALPAHTKAARATGNDSTLVGMLELVATGVESDELVPVLDAAEKAGYYVSLSLTPAEESWSTQAQQLQTLLERPHVGLSLEPGKGGISARDVGEVSGWLADLVRTKTLPQKLFTVHESPTAPVSDRASVDATRPELAVVVQVDVTGTPQTKLGAWETALRGGPKGARFGWTQFTGDQPTFSIAQTWRLVNPQPQVVSYR